MKRLRFIMVGGFLGAGKTTTLARLARHYTGRGQRVGLVTNDQAQDLVDTNSLRAQGFAVEEVAGACFCCRFDDLVGKVGQLQSGERPDVILAEPVGSCTDLVATVVQPLKDLYGERFEVAPYAVLFKPSHGLRILRNEAGAGFSPKAAYIFRKQLEEADAIVINRIDEMTPARAQGAGRPGRPRSIPACRCCSMSAKTGQGFEALTELLDQQGDFGRKILDIDYDIYAEGEAELGWLNGSVHVDAPTSRSPWTHLLLRLVGAAARGASAGRARRWRTSRRSACAKARSASPTWSAAATQPELSLPSHGRVPEADVIVNARVAADPAVIEEAGARRRWRMSAANTGRRRRSARCKASAPAGRSRRTATPRRSEAAPESRRAGAA